MQPLGCLCPEQRDGLPAGAAGGLWDAIRAALRAEGQDAELHLYGAYVTHAAQKLHDPVGRPPFSLSMSNATAQLTLGSV